MSMCSCDNLDYYSEFAEWVADLRQSKVLILSNRDVTVEPRLRGEDYYVYKLLEQLKKSGIRADTFYLSKNRTKFYQQEKMNNMENIENVVKKYDVILLHCISPFKLLKAKFKYNLKLIMPVFFLWNKVSSAFFNLKGLLGNIFWQLIISDYIATSSRVMKGLRVRGILRKIYLIPPVYECKYCNPIENANKLRKLKKRLPRKIKVVYIGSLNDKRFPLDSAVRKLRSYGASVCTLDVYTTSPIEQETYAVSNVTVNIKKKILLDKEKCKVLREAHLFIAPKRQTTMDPSMSVMEATYHGDIVIRI